MGAACARVVRGIAAPVTPGTVWCSRCVRRRCATAGASRAPAHGQRDSTTAPAPERRPKQIPGRLGARLTASSSLGPSSSLRQLPVPVLSHPSSAARVQRSGRQAGIRSLLAGAMASAMHHAFAGNPVGIAQQRPSALGSASLPCPARRAPCCSAPVIIGLHTVPHGEPPSPPYTAPCRLSEGGNPERWADGCERPVFAVWCRSGAFAMLFVVAPRRRGAVQAAAGAAAQPHRHGLLLFVLGCVSQWRGTPVSNVRHHHRLSVHMPALAAAAVCCMRAHLPA